MSHSSSPDELARAAHKLIRNWQHRDVPQADWHQAEDLICDMHAIDEERATKATERLAQEYEKYRRYEAFKAAMGKMNLTAQAYERAVMEYCKENQL